MHVISLPDVMLIHLLKSIRKALCTAKINKKITCKFVDRYSGSDFTRKKSMKWPVFLNVAMVVAFNETVSGRTMLTDKAWMKIETLPDGYHLRYHQQNCFKCEWTRLLTCLCSKLFNLETFMIWQLQLTN